MRSYLLVVSGCLIVLVQVVAQTSSDAKATESLKKIFGDSIIVGNTVLKLSPEDKHKIYSFSKQQWQQDSVRVLTCRTHNSLVGIGFVDDVKGKTQFITYLVAIDTSGMVKDVDVLAYRESYGGEIAYESFRKQFHQKTINDPLQPGNDIKNISGATISVRSITFGVKRMLAVYEVIKSRLQ